MKKVFLIGTIMCALGVNTVGKDVVTYRNPSYVNINSTTKESWDIAHMYYVEEVPYTTKAVDIYNSVVEIQYILKPYKMKDGEYKITISKVNSTLIKVEEKIDGKTIYLEMKGQNYFDPFTITNPKPEVVLKISFEGYICSIEYKGNFEN